MNHASPARFTSRHSTTVANQSPSVTAPSSSGRRSCLSVVNPSIHRLQAAGPGVLASFSLIAPSTYTAGTHPPSSVRQHLDPTFSQDEVLPNILKSIAMRFFGCCFEQGRAISQEGSEPTKSSCD